MALKQLLAIECPARVEIHEREIGVETSRNSTLPKQGNRRAGMPATSDAMRSSGTPRSWAPSSRSTARVDCTPAIPPHEPRKSPGVFIDGGAGE